MVGSRTVALVETHPVAPRTRRKPGTSLFVMAVGLRVEADNSREPRNARTSRFTRLSARQGVTVSSRSDGVSGREVTPKLSHAPPHLYFLARDDSGHRLRRDRHRIRHRRRLGSHGAPRAGPEDAGA